MSNTIFPKIIHQIWMVWSKKEMPPEWKKAQQKWKDLYSDYEYILWGNENSLDLIKKEYPQYLDMYNNFEYPIQRADFIRYCILKLYGGIYADLDIVPEKKFTDETFYGTNSDVYLMKNNNFLKNTIGVITNSLMISKKGSVFWDYVMIEVEKRYKKPSWKWIGKHTKVLHSTGPIMITHVLNIYPYCITLLPSDISICSVCDDMKNKKNTKNSYIKSIQGMSWTSYDTTIINFLLCNFQKIIIFLLICLVIFIYFFFKYKSCCNNKKCK